MKELSDVLLGGKNYFSPEEKNERESFYKEVKDFGGDTLYNGTFYGLNFVRRIDDYLSSNFRRERYESKINFAKEQVLKSSTIEKTAGIYKSQIEDEIRKYEKLYLLKEKNTKKSDGEFLDLSKEFQEKQDVFYKNKKDFSGKIKNFLNKFYNKFSLNGIRINSRNYNYERFLKVAKSDYRGTGKRLKVSKKYLKKEFKNLNFLKERLIFLYKENTKVKGALQNASLSRVFYTDYLVLSG